MIETPGAEHYSFYDGTARADAGKALAGGFAMSTAPDRGTNFSLYRGMAHEPPGALQSVNRRPIVRAQKRTCPDDGRVVQPDPRETS